MEFKNSILLLIIIYLPIILLIVAECRFKKIKSDSYCVTEQYIDLDSSLSLKGLLTIMVFFHHVSIRTAGTTHTVLLPFTQLGYIGVAGFLFLSGYVEQVGLQKRNFSPQRPITVLLKKTTRIILPYVVINILIGVIYAIFQYRNVNIIDIFTSTVYIKNIWNGLPNWYVIAISSLLFIYYLAVYLSQINTSLKRHIPLFVLCGTIIYILICIICKADEFWYNSALAFAVGVFSAEYKKQIFRLFNKFYYLKLIACWLFMLGIWALGFFGSPFNTLIHSMAAVMFAICIGISFVRLNLKGKVLRLIGKVSYEHFLIQSAALIFVYDLFKPNNPFFVLAMFIGILMICLPLQMLFKGIQNMLIKKQV